MALPMNQHGGGYVPGEMEMTSGHQGSQYTGYQSHFQPNGPPPAHLRPHENYGGFGNFHYQQPPQYHYSQPQLHPQLAYSQSHSMPQHSGQQYQSRPSGVGTVDYVDSEAVDEYNDVTELQKSPSKPAKLRGYGHIFDENTKFRWKNPHWYQPAGWFYTQTQTHRSRDGMARVFEGAMNDLYPAPYSGRLKSMTVMTTDDIYENGANSTYNRTFIRNVGPIYLRIAGWPTDHWSEEAKQNMGMVILKWIPTAIALIFTLSSSFGDEGATRNFGRYDAFPYRYYGYSKVARSYLEDHRTHGKGDTERESNQIAKRLLRPRYLCFLKHPESHEMLGVQPMAVDEWITQYRDERNLSYIFVAYTVEQFSHNNRKDMEELHRIAEKAARDAGVAAYWIGCSCMPEVAKVHEDVYRISDVIRGAHSTVIAVGAPVNGDKAIATTHEMIRQWGTRLWTFPEVLLSPKGLPIKVYTRGTDLREPLLLEKRQFAARVWEDADISRQLIDHYEGTLILSRLELVTLALKCLHKRQTTEYLPGDHSYALMGLLRLRPTVDASDSGFQAFARLSLANDNDELIERLICTLPNRTDQPWYSFEDAYGASTWDIYPSCQIAGVADEDTVIIDGAHAASVCWRGFSPVYALRRMTIKRRIARFCLHSVTFIFIIAMALLGMGPGMLPFGIILLVYCLIIGFSAPYLLKVMYCGKVWYTQPWFFGFEGYLDIDTIEYQIFGVSLKRLSWSPFGSPLSRHHKDEHGECIGDDPCTDPSVRALVNQAKYAKPGDQRIFTLVDTCTMKVTLFKAARPPVMFMLCGSEGGMQRAMGCSYDWTTGTLYRETVLRMETPVIEKMDRLPRARFGFRRPDEPVSVKGAI